MSRRGKSSRCCATAATNVELVRFAYLKSRTLLIHIGNRVQDVIGCIAEQAG